MKKAILLFYFCICTTYAWALQSKASLTPETIYLAKPFTLTITVTSNQDIQALVLPQKNDFLPLNLIKTRKEKNTNTSPLQYHFDLQCFSPEENRIPTLNFLFASQIQRHNVTLPSFKFNIKSHFSEEEKSSIILENIYQSIELPFKKKWLIYPLLIFIGLCLIVAVLIYLFKKNKKKSPQEQSHLTPLEAALLNLDHLQKKSYFNQNKHKDFYTKLSFILKEFLSETYKIHLLDRTSQECIFLLDAHCESHYLRKIKSLLQESDYVKFAKIMPPASEEKESIKKCQDLIIKLHKETQEALEKTI